MTFNSGIDLLRKNPKYIENAGMTYSASTFTITGANGSALGARNPLFVTVPSKTNPGRWLVFRKTTAYSFIDDSGASQIAGNTFGTTAGVVQAIMPFFLYWVLNDAETDVTPMISRYPNSSTSPVAARIGKPSSAIADFNNAFWALDDSITVADYESNPCVSYGSFRMQKTTGATNDWTVQTLNNGDGWGMFQEDTQFGVSAGQFGNAAGKYFLDNGGTAPAFTISGLVYYLNMQNEMSYYNAMVNCSTAGVGAVTLAQGLPFNSFDGATQGSGYMVIGAGVTMLGVNTVALGSNLVDFPFVNPAGTGFLADASVPLTATIAHNGKMSIQFS